MKRGDGERTDDDDAPVSTAERELFGWALVHDTSWARHEEARYGLRPRGARRTRSPPLCSSTAVLIHRGG
ncbi:hypothetical protein ACL02R_25290 [Streptomyces sp. MS19]|uniref:hypothetical protein n=1 Tax=Streptomyces sp. MS19 TaxID=3385972 RepID=UPI0039A1B063